MNRRNILTGLAGIFAAGFAPAAVGSGVLMPVRLVVPRAPTLLRTPNHMAVDVCQVSVSTMSALMAVSIGLTRADGALVWVPADLGADGLYRATVPAGARLDTIGCDAIDRAATFSIGLRAHG